MPIAGMSEEDRKRTEGDLLAKMEAQAVQLRDLILSQPPRDLISYLMHGLLRWQSEEEGEAQKKRRPKEGPRILPLDLEQVQFLLEYVHAALATSNSPASKAFDESIVKEIVEVSQSLWMSTMRYCMLSSAGTSGGVFGDKTADIEFRAKSSWFVIRGHRYQALEGEFYEKALAPHDDICREVYGISASEIASEMQAISDSMRLGHMRAYGAMADQFDAVSKIIDERNVDMKEAVAIWEAANPGARQKAGDIFRELFAADTGNLSKHTKLPTILLEDLAYDRGENADFFAAGAFAGTPLRTLPVRIKPLIKLDGEFLAVDPSFVRDASYRALLFHLLRRRPDYRETFDARQKEFSETAFASILSSQTQGSAVYREVYYRNVDTGQWVENDTLLLLDDVLVLVEAKSGANATIASPAIDFPRHVRDVQDLVAKAFTQCDRFFNYLASAAEVPIFKLEDGKYVEAGRLRASDYRLMFPIGLTVESFSPFSAMCKALPGIRPLLGRYPFVSMSIDDLLVLNRLFPTAGEFFHYLAVRQRVAGIEVAHLYDEMDHAGSYISKNRFDMDIERQLAEGNATLLIWDGFSKVIDDYFGSMSWERDPPPSQDRSPEVKKLLSALQRSKEANWLLVDHHIRDLSGDAQAKLGNMLSLLRESLANHDHRWFLFGDEEPLFVWVQRVGSFADYAAIRSKAAAATIAMGAKHVVTVLVFAEADGSLARTVHIAVPVPLAGSKEFLALQDDAEKIAGRKVLVPPEGRDRVAPLPKRNEPCWCGSGQKFKKCHGR